MQKIHLLIVSFILFSVSLLQASQVKTIFAEVAQHADLIVVGTTQNMESSYTAGKKSIATKVVFSDLTVLGGKKAGDKLASQLSITYMGGTVGEISMRTSDMPNFELGQRYIIFVKQDGKSYVNPLIGGMQGLFKVMKDASTGVEYILDANHYAVLDMNEGDLVTSSLKVLGIDNGQYKYLPKEHLNSAALPLSTTPADSYVDFPVEENQEKATMTVELFRQLIQKALKHKVKTPMLQYGGKGKFHFKDGTVQEFETLVPKYDPSEQSKTKGEDNANLEKGGTLGWCGYQDLNIVMEQLPESWETFGTNNHAMWTWNQFMDMYRYLNSDGTIGNNNGQNEFSGWMTNERLKQFYNFEWGGSAIALCVNWSYSDCRRITESDIIFNSARSWTNDFNVSLGGTRINLLPVIMHELGHTFGYQLGKYEETYDYDQPSVMHAYYSNVVEDGKGIHRPDAYIVRRIYDDQKTPLNVKDVGCESYYASNGLKNATTDKTYYNAGERILVNKFTVENMSRYNTSNVRLRFFLSSNKNITTSDTQIGGDWYWTTFNAESYTTFNYDMRLPYNIASGWYYVGAIVTSNGYGSDGYSGNDKTFLYRRVYIYGSNANENPEGRSQAQVEEEMTFEVYPNPNSSTDHFTLQVGGKFEKSLEVAIYNTLGQKVEQHYLSADHNGQSLVFGSNIPRGNYYLKVSDKAGVLLTQQLLVKL